MTLGELLALLARDEEAQVAGATIVVTLEEATATVEAMADALLALVRLAEYAPTPAVRADALGLARRGHVLLGRWLLLWAHEAGEEH